MDPDVRHFDLCSRCFLALQKGIERFKLYKQDEKFYFDCLKCGALRFELKWDPGYYSMERFDISLFVVTKYQQNDHVIKM